MQIGTLIKRVKTYLPHVKEKRLREVYTFARDAHKGQKRMDGSPYMDHPLNAALILTQLRVDEDTLVACLLHDVPEDTDYTIQDIEKRFGKKVAFLVDGVTKLSKVKYRHDMVERQVESLKKFFLHSARDLRIILIKLADRLHNLKTLEFVRKEKQLRIAKETMEIYVAIADLLGIWEFKSLLEDLCFQYIYPKEYTELKKQIKKEAAHQGKLLKKTTQMINNALKQHKIVAEVQSRPKSLYSIFRKMVDTGRDLRDLNDLLALRIIVENNEMCYRALGIIHSLYRPKAGRIKDYLALPKANGYQSLHTTVFGVDGIPTEFQIRTHEMHFEAQYGIAAHYFYKQQTDKTHTNEVLAKRATWVQRVLDLQKELKNNYDFLDNLKIDVFQDRIFVFTPQGDVIDLPNGANGIDFAYHIHSAVGDKADHLYLNGKSCPLITTLQTGDTAKVITSKTQKLPKREWLEKVKTTVAKNKIRASLKRQTAAESSAAGIEFLKKELKRYGCNNLESFSSKQKKQLLETFGIKTWHVFLELVGNGNIAEKDIIQNLYTLEQLLGKPHKSTIHDKTPLDEVAYRGTNSRLLKTPHLSDSPYYRVDLQIIAVDRVGFMRDIGIQLATLGVNVYQIGVDTGRRYGKAHVSLVVEVMDFTQLRSAFDAIEAVDGVLEVYRVTDQESAKGSKRAKRS